MKQTAVEWLKSQILEGSINIENGEMYIKLPKDALNKAKAMEKEQIIDSYTHDRLMLKITAEQYYNENFKSE